jgi:hypothetical protein
MGDIVSFMMKITEMLTNYEKCHFASYSEIYILYHLPVFFL